MHVVIAQNFLAFIYQGWLTMQKVLESEWVMEGASGWISTRIPPNPKLLDWCILLWESCVFLTGAVSCVRVCLTCPQCIQCPSGSVLRASIPAAKMHLKCCWGNAPPPAPLTSWILIFWWPHLSARFSYCLSLWNEFTKNNSNSSYTLKSLFVWGVWGAHLFVCVS